MAFILTAAFVLQQGQSLAEHSIDLLPLLAIVVVGLLGILITGLGWYFRRLESKFVKLESQLIEMREERREEIESTANTLEQYINDLKKGIKDQLDELSRDVKQDIGEMSKVKQRLVAIEVKLGIPVHMNGENQIT